MRSGGLIPVKLSRTDPTVSWQPGNTVSPDSDLECPEKKIVIALTGHQGLGCSICKVRDERKISDQYKVHFNSIMRTADVGD